MEKQSERSFKKELRKQTVTYMTAAFAFVVGLAWNEAFKALIEFFFPLENQSIWIKFIYALVITVVVVLVTYFLLKKEEE